MKYIACEAKMDGARQISAMIKTHIKCCCCKDWFNKHVIFNKTIQSFLQIKRIDPQL
jgi:hypothetical protein